MNTKSTENKEQMKKRIKGIVTARRCECCGHHEIGITTDSGKYISLRPGMIIEILEQREIHQISTFGFFGK